MQPFLATDAFSRHKKLINDYLRYYGGSMEHFRRSSANDKTDYDVIQEHHRFIWDEEDEQDTSWGKSLAKKYYDKLFKEYCISDLSRYKENKFAMRWRTEKEVIDGKGQFICGGRKCEAREGLQSWEVNFGYMEHGAKKNALVKLRLCSECSEKLNLHQRRKLAEKKTKKKELKSRKRSRKEKKNRKKKKKKKENSSSSDNSHESEESEDESKKDGETTDGREESQEKKNSEDDSTKAIWSQPAKKIVEKSREEELEDYLEDLFF